MEKQIDIKYDIVIKEHFKTRYIERIDDIDIFNNIINIIINKLNNNDNNLIKILLNIFLNWKNNKINYTNEGKCIIVYEYNNILYKISCKINIIYNKQCCKYNFKLIFTTFMNVFTNDQKQINYLNQLIKKYSEKKMFITFKNMNLYFLPDYF